MAPTLHSAFSASSSQRLLSCPGSFELGRRFDTGRKSSVYSAEGTLAHAVSEACIFTGKNVSDFVGQVRSADGFDFTIDDEFADAAQTYVDFVSGLRAMGYVVALERRVSPQVHWDGLKPLNIDLFGTSDCIAYHPYLRHLLIGDLKFGAGIAVEVAHNPQLLYYGAGSMHESVLRPLVEAAGYKYLPPEKVTTVIIQPRAHHPAGPVRHHNYTPEEVRDFARITLYSGVKRALSDKGQTLEAGTFCRFCPALPHCEKPKEAAFEVARAAFANAPIENVPFVEETNPQQLLGELTDEQLGELLDKIELARPWMDAVKNLALERSEKGRRVKGWKSVPKRSRRQFVDDPEQTLQVLDQTGLDPKLYSRRVPLTPAQVERKAGKKAYEQFIAPHVVKNSSGNTLAPEGDPRARIRAGRTAQEAFATPATNQ